MIDDDLVGEPDGLAALGAGDAVGGVLEPVPAPVAQGVGAAERDRLFQDLQADGASQVFASGDRPIA